MRNREVRKPVSVVPAANATYDVKLPTGHYLFSVHIKSDLVDGASTKATVTPYVDKGITQLNSLKYMFFELDDTVPFSEITLTNGAAGRSMMASPTTGHANTIVVEPVYVVGGVQVGVTKGNGVAGETLEIMIIATRVA